MTEDSLNGILGPLSYRTPTAEYHCLLAGVCGSVAFLFSSALQIYDCANKTQSIPTPSLVEDQEFLEAWMPGASQEHLLHPRQEL